ncbi:hypothetical protein [Rubrobacter aplysinae]|uniref:hypothetical protein n=1 Tax=Rubrobacter aplysinae TaxID=909625 RepID=UPI00128E5E04|nr:hypothetical protein [Rubrobacter aplysinae]
MISYDNAIEVAISTYLTLHPIQRLNREYARADIQQWLSNYHTKIDFFMEEISSRDLSLVCEKAEFVWYHDVRNGQYHSGGATVPQGYELEGIREAALWVFSTLYDVTDTEQHISEEIEKRSPTAPQNDVEYDEAINNVYDDVNISGRKYSVSEILFTLDEAFYREVGAELCESANYDKDEGQSA